MLSDRVRAYSVLVLAALVAFMPPMAQAELDCTDFLTFSYPGHTRLPADAFDYNSTVRVMRVASGRLDSFTFPDAEKGYFFVALSPYTKANATVGERNVSMGQVVYQYTQGASEYYYRALNGSTFPWYCNLEKMADLTVTTGQLNGTFYTASGERLAAASSGVVVFDAGVDDGFWVPGFGTARRFYVGLDENVSGLPVGYAIYDAGNSTYFATGYKQVRFHVPANATAFCNNYASFCLDASGTHASACRGSGLVTYSCGNNQCVANLTACKHGCDAAVCLEATPTPEATVTPTAVPATPSETAATVTPAAATVTVTPARGSGDLTPAVVVLVGLLLAAGAYVVLFQKRRPKGL